MPLMLLVQSALLKRHPIVSKRKGRFHGTLMSNEKSAGNIF
jgi:hypothetical protein